MRRRQRVEGDAVVAGDARRATTAFRVTAPDPSATSHSTPRTRRRSRARRPAPVGDLAPDAPHPSATSRPTPRTRRHELPLWATGTDGLSIRHAITQRDGNLVLYNHAGQPKWASNTHGNPGARLVVQCDGNLVIYAP